MEVVSLRERSSREKDLRGKILKERRKDKFKRRTEEEGNIENEKNWC